MKTTRILTSIIIALLGTSFASNIEGLGSVIYEISETETNNTETISLSNISFSLIQRHLGLIKKEKTIDPIDNTLQNIQKLESLARRDIIQELNISTNKSITIKQYVEDSNTAINESLTIEEVLRGQLLDIESAIIACKIDKDRSDQAYFISIDTYNQEESIEAINLSIAADACASRNRIQYNAKMYIQNKLKYYTNIVQAKSKIIDQEQDNLILHFDVMRSSILERLNNITQSLTQYNL